MKTIVIPIDFSANSINALDYAAALTRHLNGKLILVHILNLPIDLLDNGVVVYPEHALEEIYRIELQELSSNIKDNYQIKVEVICRYGVLITDLNELIQFHEVDLVVMGTKGVSNFFDKLIGSNTYNFMKIAVCPVLAVPFQASFSGIKHITYASDFESEESIFLEQLFSFTGPFQAKLAIINILAGYETNILADEQVVKEIGKYFPQVNYTIIQIKERDIPQGIHEYIDENKSDILAFAMHERNFLEMLFHNCITNKLIFHITKPLLVLPEKPYRHQTLTSKHQASQIAPGK